MTGDQFVVWCAGFFDGEGSVSIVKSNGGASFALHVTITQNVREVLERIETRFGGTIHLKHDNGLATGPVWEWFGCGATAVPLLTSIQPFLLRKRDEVDVALEFQQLQASAARVTAKQIADLVGVCERTVWNVAKGKSDHAATKAAIIDLGYVTHHRLHKENFSAKVALRERLKFLHSGMQWQSRFAC